jgi:hypothetical protein
MKPVRIAAAVALAFTFVAPASASASDDTVFDQKVAALVAASQKNFTVTYETENEVPYTFRIKDKQRWETVSIEENVRVFGETEYTQLSPQYAARAKAAGKSSWKWYVGKNFQPAPTLMIHGGSFLVAAKYGTVTRDGKAYVLSAEFDYTQQSFEEIIATGPAFRADYRVTLDSRGRIATVTGSTSTYLPGSDEAYKSYRTMRFSYGTVNIAVPARSTVATITQLDALPRLSPLDDAAMSTAYDANVLAAAARSRMSVDLIAEAASGISSPDGLEATYLTNGLKYTLDGRSMCILISTDEKKAVVTRC